MTREELEVKRYLQATNNDTAKALRVMAQHIISLRETNKPKPGYERLGFVGHNDGRKPTET